MDVWGYSSAGALNGLSSLSVLRGEKLYSVDAPTRHSLDDQSQFSLIMGGFTYDFGRAHTGPRGQPAIRILLVSDLLDVLSSRRAGFGTITAKQIDDRSKADTLVKVLTCFQAAHLVVRFLAWVGQRLPVTSLEVSTAGYIPWTILSYYFWRDKAWPSSFAIHSDNPP